VPDHRLAPTHDEALRRVVRLVALLNLAYFGVEFAVALAIGSVSLFADSVDFLEDASLNLLILMALGWSARARARLGMLLAGIILVPGIMTAYTLSVWPDLVVGLGIALMNADAAREVFDAARREHKASDAAA
jgi:Co/Zn/Cd efflux system component